MEIEKYSLKDDLFNKSTISQLSSSIKKVYPVFEENTFLSEIMYELDKLELKERMSLICTKIHKFVKEDYPKVTSILLDSLKTDKKNTGFVFGAYSEYVERYGCNDEQLELSLEMLSEYTKYFSAEFAIRKFINNYPHESYEMLLRLSVSDDTEQRRFASEGLRQKLPWSIAIKFDYKKGAEPLNNLFYDKERYVTRSVANHLNDISKFDPVYVVDLLKLWKDSGKQDDKEMEYIINHSLRTSIKKGHKYTLEFLGYKQGADISIESFSINNPSIVIGDTLEFEFELRANEETNLIVDYKVIYPMAKGKTSEKVFKLKKLSLSKNESIRITKKHTFKPMTTKKLYAGRYQLIIQVNGEAKDLQEFNLII